MRRREGSLVLIIHIDASTPPSLGDAENFRAFKVECASERSACTDAFAEVGRLDGDHLWVDPAWLRSHGRPGADWAAGLQKMIDYAVSAGWVDGVGAIRAHIEDVQG